MPIDPRGALEQKAATIDAAVQDVYGALDVAGLAEATASGRVDVCGSQPVPGVRYVAGMSVKVGDDLAGGFRALVEQLTATGWQPTDAYDDVKIDPAKPMARFSRDDITLDVKTGGASIGGEQYGGDEMQLGFTLEDPCVRIPDGSSSLDFQDLDRKILPRG
ncbi:hypothetical protein ACFWHT_04650 [Microbacterium sp. NPDC058342]|uniref:hypothetical protein n=1 Tax=Microbacterium sp. NPDC058342 TaxID=3346454 RepID=UPI0036687525